MKNSQLKIQWPWFDLLISFKVKFYKVNLKAIYDLLYVFHANLLYDALFMRYNLLKILCPLFDI